jgi:hypothetical protein
MAREFKTGYKVTGDASGGVRAAQATRGELDKLNNTIQQQTKLGKFAASETGKFTAGIAGMATVAVGAIVGIGRFAKSIADQGDRVRDLSIQLGMSTEFISGMGYAADLSGSSLEGFAKGAAKMERAVVELSKGTITQVEAFDRLGLTYTSLKNLSPEQQFLTIAERMSLMEDKGLRLATAIDIFGKSGADLIPLLAEGSEGITAMTAEAERLGLVMSQEFADASDSFNDNLTRSQGVVEGLKRQFAEGLLPQLSAVMEAFVESADSTESWTEVGTFFGNLVRVLVAGFITLREIVILTGETIWATGKVIVETLIAIAAPVLEFGNTLSAAFRALTSGDFAGAAAAFTGLGDRMKDAFVDNITAVGLTLKEFGQGAAKRVEEAVKDVNDVLTRQASVSADAAAGMEDLGEKTGQSAKEAEAAAKAYETLADRLDPLSRLQRQFTIEQGILAAKIAEGGDGVTYYTQLLEILKEQYASAARDAVGFGDKAAAAAEKASERAAAAAQKEADARAAALAQQATDVETFQKAFERGIERLDDLGADLWKSWFTGAKSAMDSIKSFFQNWLAEMAHAAITRPILVSITAAMGLGGASSAAAGVPGLTGALGGLGGAGGLSGALSGIGSLFTGSGIGLGLQNLPTWLGGVSSGIGSSGAPALFGNAAAYSNWQYGLTGILGGLLGDKVFGGQGGLGGGIGSTLGLAAFGPLGAILGGLAGGALGGLFGKDKPAVLDISGYSQANQSGSDSDSRVDTAFGTTFLRARRLEAADVAQFADAIQTFDESLASFMDEDQISQATSALKSWELHLEGSAISLEKYLGGRFAIILGTFSQDMQDFVEEVSGLEGQVERLALASTAQKIIDAAPELFEGRTFREFIAVAEAMQGAGEDLTATFQRLMQQVVIIANQQLVVRGYADSNLTADFDAIVSAQGMTLKDLTSGFANDIRDLGASFTGSADDLNNLSRLVSQRYDSELAYLAQIQQVANIIATSFTGLKEQISRDLFGDEAFYDQITGQAEQLAADLKSMTDPAKIAATVAEIQRLTGIAYSLLDEDGKKTNGQGFLDFIEGVESDASESLQLARDLFIEESAVLRTLVQEMADAFADPLAIAAGAHEDAAAALYEAGITLRSAAADLGRAVAPATGTPIAAGSTGSVQQTNSDQIVSRLERLENAILSAGQATVGAIYANGAPQVTVVTPGPSAVLR